MYEKPFRLKLRGGAPMDYGDARLRHRARPRRPPRRQRARDVSRWMAVPWQTDTSSCLFAYIGWQEGVFLPTFWPVRVPNNVLTADQYETVMNARKPYSERFEAFAFDHRQYWLRFLAPREDYKSVINEFVKEWNGVGVVTQMPGPTDPEDPYQSSFPPVMHVERGVTNEKKGGYGGRALANGPWTAACGRAICRIRGRFADAHPGRDCRRGTGGIRGRAVTRAAWHQLRSSSSAAMTVATSPRITPAFRAAVAPIARIAEALNDHLAVYGQRSAWGSEVADETPFLFLPYGNGWHLDRRRFEQLLIDRALAWGAVRLAGARVVDVRRHGRTWALRLQNGTSLDSAFLIDATGRASWLARRLGARRMHHDPLVASVAFLDGGRCNSTTLVEATECGWWYSAALPDDRLAVMSISDAPLAWDPPTFTRTRIERGGYAMPGSLRRVDAGSARLDRVGGEGWLAIGDAVMAVDPTRLRVSSRPSPRASPRERRHSRSTRPSSTRRGAPTPGCAARVTPPRGGGPTGYSGAGDVRRRSRDLARPFPPQA